jgi:hypothetical protein
MTKKRNWLGTLVLLAVVAVVAVGCEQFNGGLDALGFGEEEFAEPSWADEGGASQANDNLGPKEFLLLFVETWKADAENFTNNPNMEAVFALCDSDVAINFGWDIMPKEIIVSATSDMVDREKLWKFDEYLDAIRNKEMEAIEDTVNGEAVLRFDIPVFEEKVDSTTSYLHYMSFFLKEVNGDWRFKMCSQAQWGIHY